jgi:glycosyltransferase involved in cell wall biosynthesis
MTKQQQEQATTLFGCPRDRTGFLRVGVDTEFFHPGRSSDAAGVRKEIVDFARQQYWVAAGDQLRDEMRVLDLVKRSAIPLVRITRNRLIVKFWADIAKTTSVPILCIANVTWTELKYIYQNALSVVNLVDSSWQPAGWTAVTEAMACGVPVIVNHGLVTVELRRYLKPGESVPFIEIREPAASLALEEILRLLSSPQTNLMLGQQARRFVMEHLSIERMATEFADLCGNIVGSR